MNELLAKILEAHGGTDRSSRWRGSTPYDRSSGDAETSFNELCRTPEPHDAHERAPFHALDECFFQEV